MSTRRALICFALFAAYCGLLAWPVAWFFQESGWGGSGVALGFLILGVGSLIPVVVLMKTFRGRRQRFASRLKANEGLMSRNWGVLISLGTCLSVFSPSWLHGVGFSLAAFGAGFMLWEMIRALPVGEPPDDITASAQP